MADQRVTKARMQNHWAYNWWKYLLMVVLAVMAVDVGFSVTAYRPPEDKKVEVYLCVGMADAERFEADLWSAFKEAAPDQEQLTALNINLAGNDAYARMQFSTYIAAQQGDLCLLPLSEVQRLAGGEAWDVFADLTPYVESGALAVEQSHWVTYSNEEGEERIYGIASDFMSGLEDYGIDPAGGAWVVTAFSGNEENVVRLLNLVVDRCADGQ